MEIQKNILIRLPNWLGDMVMASAFVAAVQNEYPNASIDLIAKKGIDFLLDYFPNYRHKYVFSKEEYKGILGVKKFAKGISLKKEYDLFFCLPESLSAAVMTKYINAKKSIGFKKSFHFLFINSVYERKKNVHRVEEYINLLEQFAKHEILIPQVKLFNTTLHQTNALVININSEASSRRLPHSKAVSIINKIRKEITNEIILVGSPKEKTFVDEVFASLKDKKNIENIAGQTSLAELVKIFSTCKAILTTDSGPAHVCNALGKNVLVLFGAGNEKNTAPYNNENSIIMRLGKLPCEPCVKNTCKVFELPECLIQLDENLILENIKKILNKNEF